MTVLAIDTSTTACTIALKHGGRFFCFDEDLPRQQSEQLLTQIDQLLLEAGIGLSDVKLFACGTGPGSFMGCRLSVGVVQGLAYAVKRPVVGISTLRILAQTAFEQRQCESVFTAWDARMGQVYAGFYHIDEDGLMQSQGDDFMVGPQSLSADTTRAWSAVGNGWQVYRDQIDDGLMAAMTSCHADLYPQARACVRLAESISQEDYLEPQQLVSLYLRKPVV